MKPQVRAACVMAGATLVGQGFALGWGLMAIAFAAPSNEQPDDR